jgi:hypothetical protein
MNYGSTATVEGMNSSPLLAIVWSVAGVAQLATCSSSARPEAMNQSPKAPLPKSCALPSLTPAERDRQLQRCEQIRLSAFGTKESAEGFSFKVNLKKMGLTDLREWAKNEQSCCSFLTIEIRQDNAKNVAEVRVACPVEQKRETMAVFGLKAAK